jgi:hypothetical protein
LQYDTLWHLMHSFSVSGDLEHWAHVGVGADVEDEDEASGDAVDGLFVEAEAEDSSAMTADYRVGRCIGKVLEVVLWIAHVAMLAGKTFWVRA